MSNSQFNEVDLEYTVLSEYSLDKLFDEYAGSSEEDFDEETLALLRELELRGVRGGRGL